VITFTYVILILTVFTLESAGSLTLNFL